MSGCPKRLPKSIKKPPEIPSNFGYISGAILGRILAAFGLRFGFQKCIKCSMKCTGSTNSSLQASPGTSRKWLQNSIDFHSQKVCQKGSQKAPKRSPKTTLKNVRKKHQKNIGKIAPKMNRWATNADQPPPSEPTPSMFSLRSPMTNGIKRNVPRMSQALPVILLCVDPDQLPLPNLPPHTRKAQTGMHATVHARTRFPSSWQKVANEGCS